MTSRHGEIVLIRPIDFSHILIFIITLTLIVILYLTLGHYTRSIPVKGVLKSRAGETKIMAYQTGIVEDLYISEGDRVIKGSPLYKIKTDRQGVDGSVNKKLISSLKNSISLIEDKISYQEELNELEINDLINLEKQFKSKAVNIDEEIAIKRDYLNLLSSELSIISKLMQKKQVSQTEYNAKYAQVLDARLDLKTLSRTKIEYIEKSEVAGRSIRNITVRGKSMIVEYQQSMSMLKRQLASKESDDTYIISAPNTGYVANSFLEVGHFVELENPLLVLLPDNNELVAEVYIPTSAIGQVKLGQNINLRYQAFPYQSFGVFPGTIEEISQTLIQPFQAEVEILVEAPSYRAIVILEKQNIDIENSAVKLQTGMLLDADVIGDTRSMLSWIFGPIMTPSNNT